jgi:hypothetical protein
MLSVSKKETLSYTPYSGSHIQPWGLWGTPTLRGATVLSQDLPAERALVRIRENELREAVSFESHFLAPENVTLKQHSQHSEHSLCSSLLPMIETSIVEHCSRFDDRYLTLWTPMETRTIKQSCSSRRSVAKCSAVLKTICAGLSKSPSGEQQNSW